MSDIPEEVTITEEPVSSAPSAAGKKSNTLLNIIMILLGLIFFARGIFDFLTWLNLFPFPPWLQKIYATMSSDNAKNALSFLGPQAIISSTLGFWAFVAGILMIRERETGWGMAMVVLSTVTLMGVSAIINWINVPSSFDLKYWPTWISMLSVLAGGFGFIWLLITRRRFS